MRTTGASACRVAPVGHLVVKVHLHRSWTNCSSGIARVVITFSANPKAATTVETFRAYARRGRIQTWTLLSIVVRAGQPGRPAPAGTQGYSESTNWSGYVVPSSSSVIDHAIGTWTVPTLNCSDTPNAAVSEWVGLGGVSWPSGGNSGALLQTGIEDRCVDGTQQDDAWWELYPSSPNESIVYSGVGLSPGDVVTADVYRTGNGRWITKIDDVSKNVSGIMETGVAYGTTPDAGPRVFTREGSTERLTYSGGYSAEWIVEDSGPSPGQLTPFANYGTISFSNLAISLPSWTLTSTDGVELVQHGTVLSTPGQPAADGFDIRYTGP
ncbi:MAG: G1 family glutamic endopeptidase [Acidimicrobiales bacterium]